MAEKARMTFRFNHDAKGRPEGDGAVGAGAHGRAAGAAAAGRAIARDMQEEPASRTRKEAGSDERNGSDDIERLERLIREAGHLPPPSVRADKPGPAARTAVPSVGEAGFGTSGGGSDMAFGVAGGDRAYAGGTDGCGIEGAGTYGDPWAGTRTDRAVTDANDGGTAADGPVGVVLDEGDAGASGAGADPANRSTSRETAFFRVDRAAPRAGGESPPSWFRVFLAVTGAIATGAAFGYLVLHLFAGQVGVPAGRPVAPEGTASLSRSVDQGELTEQAVNGRAEAEGGGAGTPAARDPEEAAVDGRADPALRTGADAEASTDGEARTEPDGRPDADAPAAAGARPEPAVIPADLFYLLQYGVFSTEDGMREAVRAAREQGLAAVPVRLDGYRVFVGVAPTRDDAERLARLMGDATVYIKVLEGEPLPLPAAGWPDGLPAFFEQGGELARQLARLSLSALRGPSSDRIGDGAMQELREAHAVWEQTSGSLGRDESLAGEAQTLVSAAAGKLDEAFGHLEAYQTRPERSRLWEAQTAVMEALLALHRLRGMLATAEPAALAERTESAGQA